MAERKIIDIAGPEDSKLDIGSKPMIIGHKNVSVDPMMKESKTEITDGKTDTVTVKKVDSIDVESKISTPTAGEKVINPVNEDSADETKNLKTNSDEEVKEKTTDKTTRSDKTEDKTEIDEKSKTEELDPVALQMEKEQKNRELIESKKYFVNIKQEKSTNFKKWFLGIFLTLIILIGALFVFIDTGVIDLGVKLPFSIFGNDNNSVIENSVPQKDTTENTQEAPQESSELVEDEMVASNPGSTNFDGDYSIEIPKSWQYKRTVKTDSDLNQEYYIDSYTLPSGTILKMTQDLGGRGGDCIPEDGDIPGEAGNFCPSMEYLKKTRIEPTESEAKLFDENYAVDLVHKKFISTDAKESYFLCLLSNRPGEFDPAVNELYMGLVTDDCFPGVAFKNAPYLIMSIEGVDNNTEQYFVNDDIVAIEKSIATINFKTK